jgi:hypothetical protein
MFGKETQASISDWATDTFGPASSNARVAARANEELAELLRVLTVAPDSPKVMEKAADTVIVLYRLAARMGQELRLYINPIMNPESPLRWAAWASDRLARALVFFAEDDDSPDAFTPLQGCVTMLGSLAHQMGKDLAAEIDRKMAVNRAREWRLDGSGHGYHVRDKEA